MRIVKGAARLVDMMLMCYVAYEFRTLAQARRSARDLARAKHTTPMGGTDGGTIHVLVPGINETAYVARTVAAFEQMLNHDPAAHVWFALTIRETDRPSTWALLEQEIVGKARMHLVMEDALHGNKSSQLNYAVDRLTRRGLLTDEDTVAIFDFDSVPNPLTLPMVRAQRRTHDVVQVVPVPAGALAGPPTHPVSRAAVLVDAQCHLRRALGIEYVRLSARGASPVQYAMGAGLFLSARALREAGGFPFVDDITLGYELSLRGRSFGTVPCVNVVDVPNTFTATMNSMVLVSRGVFSWIDVLASEWTNAGVSSRRRGALTWLGLHESFEITAYPWLGLFRSLSLVRCRSLTGVVACTAFWAFPVLEERCLRSIRSELLPETLWEANGTLVIALAGVRRFWRTFGAFRLGARYVRGCLSGTGMRFEPTRRAGG